MWNFGAYATYVSGILASVDMIRNGVIAKEHTCYVKYVKDCISSVKSTTNRVIYDVYFRVKCKKET